MIGESLGRDTQSPVGPPIIVVSHVYKRYPVNEYRPSLRHEPLRAIRSLIGISPEVAAGKPFWALQDVSFTVLRGEAVGVVGRNGAGKSTLFRLLSNVSSPTQGEIQVRGKYSALIALGTGFNLERTGLENIYLNAAIYGMPPRQIKPMIDDIVAFSELESFISFPVKRYSSGMIARLGFSVAVHLAPDIVFIDEVLAVGDPAFQKKCIQRIMEMKAEGRTLMFVSHSVDMVGQLCERTIWLDHGKIIADGPTAQVLEDYKQGIKA
jgi:ABC-type polysaccharide/polyol phosphate transport system ATPase subunit